jgi:hypothetical protein
MVVGMGGALMSDDFDAAVRLRIRGAATVGRRSPLVKRDIALRDVQRPASRDDMTEIVCA